uniref:muramidase family protein n=1 Tax=Geminisphaera colitermitum TaxID=1148786 RepID=UPI0005BD872E
MKMMQVFGVVVAIHLVVAISIVALPGCRSGGKAQTASDHGTAPADTTNNALVPAPIGSTNPPDNSGAPVRFSPSRPTGQPIGATLTPVDYPVAQLAPADLTPAAAPIPAPEPTAPATTYEVQKGDSLWTISRKHGISTNELALANNLSDKATLRIGQKLIVPSRTAAAATGARVTATAATTAGGTYTVVSGDTLGGIARKHGVKIADLRTANKLKGDNLRVGQILTLPANAGTPSPAATTNASPAAVSMTHTVVAGDTLGNIARQYHVTVGEIATANNITDPTKLRIGQELRIPGTR